jgi:hypothetical protein
MDDDEIQYTGETIYEFPSLTLKYVPAKPVVDNSSLSPFDIDVLELPEMDAPLFDASSNAASSAVLPEDEGRETCTRVGNRFRSDSDEMDICIDERDMSKSDKSPNASLTTTRHTVTNCYPTPAPSVCVTFAFGRLLTDITSSLLVCHKG